MGLFLSPSCVPRGLGAGSPPVTKKTVTKVGQSLLPLRAMLSDLMCPYVRKSQITSLSLWILNFRNQTN